MSRPLEPVRIFLERLEARDRREGAILAREFSVSDTAAAELLSQAGPAAVLPRGGNCLPLSLRSRGISCLRLSGFLSLRCLSQPSALCLQAPRGEACRCLGRAGRAAVSVSRSGTGRWLPPGREAAHLSWGPAPTRAAPGSPCNPGRKWLGAAERGTRKRRPAFELQEFCVESTPKALQNFGLGRSDLCFTCFEL